MGDMRIEDSFTQGPGPPSWVLGTARHYSPGHTWGRSSKAVQRWPLPQAEEVSSGDKRPVWLASGEAGVSVCTCERDGSGAWTGPWSEGPGSIQDRNRDAFFKGLCGLLHTPC